MTCLAIYGRSVKGNFSQRGSQTIYVRQAFCKGEGPSLLIAVVILPVAGLYASCTCSSIDRAIHLKYSFKSCTQFHLSSGFYDNHYPNKALVSNCSYKDIKVSEAMKKFPPAFAMSEMIIEGIESGLLMEACANLSWSQKTGQSTYCSPDCLALIGDPASQSHATGLVECLAIPRSKAGKIHCLICLSVTVG